MLKREPQNDALIVNVAKISFLFTLTLANNQTIYLASSFLLSMPFLSLSRFRYCPYTLSAEGAENQLDSCISLDSSSSRNWQIKEKKEKIIQRESQVYDSVKNGRILVEHANTQNWRK